MIDFIRRKQSNCVIIKFLLNFRDDFETTKLCFADKKILKVQNSKPV